MTYEEIVRKAMYELSCDPKVIFMGYGVAGDSRAFRTLQDVSKESCIEMPIAENLIMGAAVGMALAGYKPIIFMERHDFMFNALDALINHADKFRELSNNTVSIPIIIRMVVGSTKPIYPEIQHLQDYTEAIKSMVKYSKVCVANSVKTLQCIYCGELFSDVPTIIIEYRDLYGDSL